MEEIKKLVAVQRVEYAALWMVAVGLVVCFESGILADGAYAGIPWMEYYLETAGILCAVILIPFSLKLFSLALAKKIRRFALLKTLGLYRRWSELRLLLLAIVVWGNLLVYYLTLNDIGGLCALMGLTASFFCWPDVKRVMIELDIAEV